MSRSWYVQSKNLYMFIFSKQKLFQMSRSWHVQSKTQHSGAAFSNNKVFNSLQLVDYFTMSVQTSLLVSLSDCWFSFASKFCPNQQILRRQCLICSKQNSAHWSNKQGFQFFSQLGDYFTTSAQTSLLLSHHHYQIVDLDLLRNSVQLQFASKFCATQPNQQNQWDQLTSLHASLKEKNK